MNYDFISIPDRSKTGSMKWNNMPGADVNHVPLTTADMEFPMAPEISKGLAEYSTQAILGYTQPTQEYYNAVCGWMKKRHSWETKPEWIVTTPGVVYALGLAIEALSKPGDSVIVITPVYYPFDLCVLAKGRHIEYTTLKTDGDRYYIDEEELEEKAAKPECSLLLFCNPHNPVGRVWTKEELKAVVDICDRNKVVIIDDEIHHDLIMPGYEHVVMSTVSERAEQICVVCTAPSKTFNLAGLQGSNIFVANPELRGKMLATRTLDMISDLNCFSYKATELAYTRCEAWLEQLIQTIKENEEYIRSFMAKNYPDVNVYPLEGTYLLWLDMRCFGMTHKELELLMKEDAQLYLDEGYMFGPEGRGYERINLACSKVTLERSMERFKIAMDKKEKEWAVNGKPMHQTLKKGEIMQEFYYETQDGIQKALVENLNKPTILLFQRYFACPICQTVMLKLKNTWNLIEEHGFDLKVVVQSPIENVKPYAEQFPFEIICDPDAEMYDCYNVFEADDVAHFIDKTFVEASGGDLRDMAMEMYSGKVSQQGEGREFQVPSLFVVATDGEVMYAHYGKSVTDIPDMKEVISELK